MYYYFRIYNEGIDLEFFINLVVECLICGCLIEIFDNMVVKGCYLMIFNNFFLKYIF